MTTKLADVNDQIQKVWAPLATGQLRESLLLGQFVSKQYEGEIKKANDTVYVDQIIDPTAQDRTIGVDADVFSTQKAELQRISIVANKRAVVAYEFEDLISIQTKLTDDQFRSGMVFALGKQINNYLYSLVSPSTSSPDHVITGQSDLTADILADVNVLAAEAKWAEDGQWFGLVSPQYWGTMMKDAELKSSDFVVDMPTVRGQGARSLMGFGMYRDNSRTGKTALFLHRDAMHLVTQVEIQFKISDLHSQKKFGYVMSADIIYGAAVGIEGSKKMITVAS